MHTGNPNADGVRLQLANFGLILLNMCAAGCRAPERKDPHDLWANPKVQLVQAKRFATGVLEHYNRNKKVCYTIYSLDRGTRKEHVIYVGLVICIGMTFVNFLCPGQI